MVNWLTMAYPVHALFSFGGDLMGGVEQWSNNIRFGAQDVLFTPEVVGEPAMLAYLMGKLQNKMATGDLGYSSSVSLKWGKFNQIGENGRYRLPTQTVVQYISNPPVGVGTAVGNLPQAALAITFTTDAERGYASKGRIFIPMPVATPDATGLIALAQAQRYATGWASLLSEFNDGPLDTNISDVGPGVISGVQPIARKITGVKVGRVVDTIRSRRRSILEAYTARVGVVDQAAAA